MQYEQTELHPIEICSQPWNGRSRCDGSEPAKASNDPNQPRCPASPSWSGATNVARAEREIDEGIALEQLVAHRFGPAAADHDPLCRVATLERGDVHQVLEKPAVRLLADRAGVEDDDVGILGRGRLAEAG
jgi:hypothetical protein